MRKFNVTVNGITYEVVVDEVDANQNFQAPVVNIPTPAPVQVAPSPVQPTPVQAPPVVEVKKESTVADGEKITSPMPGTILDIRVSKGANVKAGDILLILEAMKMENEIVAPEDGTVADILVSVGASVNVGDDLVVLS
ncbi:MAG: biotin/lipoyl-binding protein [Christensenellaceae bacterium]|nr:biotin/lipoyl-binding protein [Christensenellaceae bacterium]